MFDRRRTVAGALTLAMLFAFPTTALADRGSDIPVVDDSSADFVRQPVPDAVESNRPADQSGDRVTDRPPVSPSDRITDRPTDKLIERCHVSSTDRLRPDCVSDKRPHDLNIRQLIYRLIHAGEWAKLVRLLHWLGWV